MSVGKLGLAGVVAIIALWLVWGLMGGTQTNALYLDKAVVAQGGVLYADNCASCHGVKLQGEPDWKSRDSEGFLPAPPHDETGHTWHHPDAQLFQITKFGTAQLVGGTYKSRMQGYSGVLSDDEIFAVLAYIKSTWPAEVIDKHNQINANSEG